MSRKFHKLPFAFLESHYNSVEDPVCNGYFNGILQSVTSNEMLGRLQIEKNNNPVRLNHLDMSLSNSLSFFFQFIYFGSFSHR